jgi:hypothetical protein
MVLIHSFRNESGKKISFFLVLRRTFFFVLFVISTFSVQNIHAAEITLAWDQNSEPDISGYRIYYGQKSRSYTHVVDVGNYTSCVIADLEDGKTYFFAATAYNTDAYESGYSNEVSYTGSSTNETNEPPVADAGPMQTVVEGTVVTLSGVNSSDPDDGLASYEWTLISGPYVELSGATTPEAVFTAPEAEANGMSLTFALTVTDYSGQSSTSTCIVNITAVNDPPAADAGPDQTVSESSTVMLDGSSSTDPDDGIATFEWSQTDGPSVVLSSTSTANTSFTAPDVDSAGASLVFQLTVTDNGGLQSTNTCLVNVTSSNTPPVAEAGADQTVDEGSAVTLDATNSYDHDGTIVSYLWKQVGGIAVTLSNPMAVTPEFKAPAVNWKGNLLSFELTVTDDSGLQSTDTCSVAVTDNRVTSTDTSLPPGLEKKIKLK